MSQISGAGGVDEDEIIAIIQSQMTPYYIGDSESFSVPEEKQVVIGVSIRNEGLIYNAGVIVEAV